MSKDGSEHGGHVPPAAEGVGQGPPMTDNDGHSRTKEKNEHHTLSVKEVARLFEDADVTRTERSITRWCKSDPQGEAKLDCYFDTNELKWFITPQSVRLAITEEQNRMQREGVLKNSLPVGHRRTSSETETDSGAENNENTTSAEGLKEQVDILEKDVEGRDKEISNLKTLLIRQGVGFGKQIAEVGERAGEYKADLRNTEEKLQVAEQKLLQLNPGPSEAEAKEPASASPTDPAPAVASVNSPETPPTIDVRVINHDASAETPTS